MSFRGAAIALAIGPSWSPYRRLGRVEDCAKIVEFLAIDPSDYVTEALMPVDGGPVRG
jgi:NAD(P)-dependent dehydrogenase (short-subunit alcohol dehydrogenase family)